MSKRMPFLPIGLALSASLAVLPACSVGTLTSSVREDGSVDFVAQGGATDISTQGGLRVEKNQGISLDPAGIEDGSFHIVIWNRTGSSASTGSTTGDSASTSDKSGETAEDSTSSSSKPSDSGTGSESDKTSTSSSDPKRKTGQSTDVSSRTVAGALTVPSGKDDNDTTSASESDEGTDADTKETDEDEASEDTTGKDIVYEGTLSSADEGIVTITNLDQNYYVIDVSVNHATGTLKARTYDLTAKEIAARDTKRTYDTITDLFGKLISPEGND